MFIVLLELYICAVKVQCCKVVVSCYSVHCCIIVQYPKKSCWDTELLQSEEYQDTKWLATNRISWRWQKKVGRNNLGFRNESDQIVKSQLMSGDNFLGGNNKKKKIQQNEIKFWTNYVAVGRCLKIRKIKIWIRFTKFKGIIPKLGKWNEISHDCEIQTGWRWRSY